MEVAMTAYLRDQRGESGRIWRTLGGRSSVQAPKAAFNLGVLLREQGDAEGARDAYQKAIDSDHPDVAPIARDLLRYLE